MAELTEEQKKFVQDSIAKVQAGLSSVSNLKVVVGGSENSVVKVNNSNSAFVFSVEKRG